MKPFLIALQFLTILPIQIKSKIKEQDFGRSLLYFPIVGALIGLMLAAVAAYLRFLPDLVAGACVLMASIIITGGIHLDGFADTCDGFYGSRSKDEILKIMRDSRIGVMAVAGIVTLLLLKFTLIVSIPRNFLWKGLIMMATFSRWAQALACLSSTYARTEGKAKFFIEYARKREIILGGLFTLALFLWMAKVKGVLIFASGFLCVLLFIQYAKRKIGGMSGDTIGATSEIAEAAVLFLAQCF
jgi:adenosylcobinamide-GDP ribazoletransferase